MRTLSEDEFLEFASLLDPAYCKRAWYGWIEIDQSPSSKLYYHSQLLFIGTYEEACERFWPTTTVVSSLTHCSSRGTNAFGSHYALLS